MELLPGASPDQVLAVMRQLHIDFGNQRGGSPGPMPVTSARDGYLRVIETAEVQLRNCFAVDSWLKQIHSERYWDIRALTESSARPFPLIGSEIETQLAWCELVIAELGVLIKEDAVADLTAARAVLDANVYLHFIPFTDIDWRSVLGQAAVRLIVPMVVLSELDNQKNAGREKLKPRAAKRLALMRKLLAGHERGPVEVRPGVNLEVVVDPPDHARQPNTDEEIIAIAQRLVGRRGGPVLLVTGDHSMQLRAEARGLTVVELSDGLRLPLGGDEEG
jgi:rRNA-processing protein FCF1